MCALETSNKQLNDHLVKLDLDNRKNNLILEGLPEKGPNENILDEVCMVLEKHLKIFSADIKLSAVYRLVKPPHLLPYPVTKPRKVMIKFEEKSECERVWKAKSGLKGTKIILFEDLPSSMIDNRKVLLPYFHAARRSEKVRKCSLQKDCLVIDSQRFYASDIDKIPQDLLPQTPLFSGREAL